MPDKDQLIQMICTLLGLAVGYFIFYPGVIFKTPDQLSILTLITFPLGGVLGYAIGRALTRESK